MDNWKPRTTTIEALNTQQEKLKCHFQSYLRKFEQRFDEGILFDGPSLYFHYKCIQSFHNSSVTQKFQSNSFFECVYATLVSWGMHRMGNTETKLENFSCFVNQLQNQIQPLQQIERYKIWNLNNNSITIVKCKLSSILDTMSISKSKAQLVANTKTLHHILPDLVPPIDRQYVMSFFRLRNNLPSEDYFPSSIFNLLYDKYIYVAQQNEEIISSKINLRTENWNTCFTKIIDNAIIGAA